MFFLLILLTCSFPACLISINSLLVYIPIIIVHDVHYIHDHECVLVNEQYNSMYIQDSDYFRNKLITNSAQVSFLEMVYACLYQLEAKQGMVYTRFYQREAKQGVVYTCLYQCEAKLEMVYTCLYQLEAMVYTCLYQLEAMVYTCLCQLEVGLVLQ